MIKNILLAIVFTIVFGSTMFAQTIIYVDGNKSTNGNGTSWANAYNDLNAALKYANETTGRFDIYVATGTYKPTDATLRGAPYSSDNVFYSQSIEGGFEDGITFAFAAFEYSQSGELNEFYPHVETTYSSSSSLGTRDVAFSVKKQGIRLFGGFPAGGGTRDVVTNTTRLDGDIGTVGNSSDNAYHVVLMGIGEDNYMTGDSIVVDGFLIRNGNANGTGSARCNGYGVAQNQGAGIYNLFETASGNTNTVAIRNCTFSNNYAYFGSGVFNETCNATISKCTFSSNSCKSGGAGLYINGATPKINNCTFSSNASDFFAGGLFMASTNAQLSACSFSSNQADSSGAAIYNLKGAPSITNTNFTSNTSGREAGAIRTDFSNLTLTGCTLTSNTATLMCGGLLSMKSNITATNTNFVSNSASWRAGALWIRGANSTAGSTYTGCKFESNSTTNTTDLNQGLGGALLADSSAKANFVNCNFKLNTSKRSAVFFTQVSANLTFTGTTIESNTATYGAGVGKTEYSSTLTFNNCKILNNTCTSNGVSYATWGESGSIFVNNYTGGACTMNFNGTLFSGNRIDSTNSSGTVMNFANLNVNNCVFVNNRSKRYGAAIYNDGGNVAGRATANIISSTFKGNTNEYQMGIFNAFNGVLKIRNSISDDGYYTYYVQSPSIYDAQYSYFSGNSTAIDGVANGNKFSAGAGFANAGDLDGADNIWATNDDGLNLTSGSPCRDAGFNSFSSALTTDFTGSSRLNGTIDMGAYEWVTVTPANVLTFAGDDYIQVPALTIPSEFTLEARFKTSSTGSYNTLLSWVGSDGSKLSINVGSAGKIFCYFETNGGVAYNSDLAIAYNDNIWHHIAVAQNSSKLVSIYMDGVLATSFTHNLTLNASDLRIGEWPGYAAFTGQIDEVRIWNRALCGGEINQNKACELPATNTGLMVYYKLNQGNSGAANPGITTATDASGNSRTGTLTNFDLAGTNNWMQSTTGVSTTACGAFTNPTVTASSNSPAINGGTLNLTAGSGFSSYAWTGPNGYTSNLQNPSISSVQTSAAGTYNLTASQNGCNATASTSVVVNSDPASAIALDGTDYISVPHYQLGTEFTFESKFKTAASGGYNPIVSWTGTGGNQVSLMTSSSGTIFLYRQGAYAEYYTGANTQTFNDNQWHHIAITLFAGTMKVYVDGNMLYSYGATMAAPTTTTFNVGNWPGYGAFNGQLDEVRLWTRALCSEEINNNKNCEISASSNGLLVYYKFNQGYHNADNTASTSVTDIAGGDHTGTLTGFTLTGTTSNWLLASGTGSVTTGSSCTAFNTPNLNSVIGNAITISNADVTPSTSDNTDFGVVNNAVTTTKNFTITNNGTGALSITGITVSGTDASYFTISNAPTTIAANSSAVFKVNFAPAGTTVEKNATINIASSDCRNTPYTFAVKATGILLAPGAALNFDGVNDLVGASPISIGANFTLEAKVKFSSAAGFKGVVCLDNGGEFTGIILNNGYPTFWEQGSGGLATVGGSVSLADNSWHHIAAVKTNAATNNISLYVDGVNVGVATSTLNLSINQILIGSVFGGYFFTGEIDEVRLWNRALCGGEIANATNCEISPSESGLYAYYKFNQGNAANDNTSLTSLTDATTNAKNGTFSGFALNGATSNFVVTGGVTTGTSCGSFQPADIAIENATAVDIANNDNTPSTGDNTDFGDVDINANPAVTTFTLKNVGTGTLTLNGTTKVIVTGTGFSLSQDASASIAASGSTTFNIAFDPTVTGVHTGTVTVYSNDCDESPFTFSIQGNGIGGVPTARALDFSSAGNNFVTANVGSKTVSGNYTVEMWVKPNSLHNATLFSTRVPSDGTFDIQINSSGGVHGDIGTGHCFCWKTTNADANVGYTAGTWFHIAYVVTPTKYEIYYNGVLASSGSYSNSTPLLFDNINSTLILGAHDNANNNFNGQMDEVRVWNRALCGAEIANNMNYELSGTQNGLVLYYQFNQGQDAGTNTSETTLTDVSGSGLNGTLNNFTRTGASSNWIAPGSVTAGNYAPTFIPSEISIIGDGDEIANGDNTPSVNDNTDFGNVQSGVGSKSQTFTLSNLGSGSLSISGSPRVVVSGTGFTLGSDLSAATIASGGSLTFSVNFDPAAASSYSGTVTIYNNDCDEAVYTFAITGTGFTPAPSNALNFDGANDYVGINNIDISNQSFTIDFWAKNDRLNAYNMVCGQGTPGNSTALHIGFRDNNQFTFAFYNNDINISSSYTDLNWHYWSCVYDANATGTNRFVYRDGILVGSDFSNSDYLGTGEFYIGKVSLGSNFQGSIDEVRIWNRALCVEEINNNKSSCELLNASSNLIGYYRFNDGYADAINTGTTTLVDNSGNSNNATLNNFALTGTTSNWVGSSPVSSGVACAAYSKPVIYMNGNGSLIVNNDNTPTASDYTHLGYAAVGSTIDKTFTIQNNGTINNLVLSGVNKVTVQGTGFTLLDDASETIAASSSSNFTIGYTPTTVGTHTGTVTIYSNDCANSIYTFAIEGSSVPSSALHFNGGDDIVNLGTGINSVLNSTDKLTVEAMVYPENTVFNGVIVGNYGTPNNELQFLLRRDGDSYKFFVDRGTGYTNVDAIGAVQLNTWQHVAGVWDGSEMRIYVDGVLWGTQTGVVGTSLSNSVTNYVSIGGNSASFEPFTGAIDEVRIWTRDLCVTELQHNMNGELTANQTGLLAYYQFNQGGDNMDNSSETTLTDASGNGYNGTLNDFDLVGISSNWIAPGAFANGTSAGVYFPAEMDVLGNNVSISSGDMTPSLSDSTDFGLVLANGSNFATRTITVKNTGGSVLNLSGITVNGGAFGTLGSLPATIAPGESASFSVLFQPSGDGLFTGSVTIPSDDCDEPMYTFALQGTGRPPVEATALHFDGIDDYVAIANPFYQYGKAITIEWNVNIESSQMGSGIGQGTQGVDDPAYNVWLMHLNPDKSLSFGVNTNSTSGVAYVPSNKINPGWHHIVGVATPAYTRLYVDGVLAGASSGYTGNIIQNATSEIHFGKDVRYPTGRFFQGSMDEVRIWNRELKIQEIQQFASCERNAAIHNPKALVAYYKFNQGLELSDNSTVTTLADSSTSDHDGTLNNFTLNGSTSNFVLAGPITTSNFCTPCTPYAITLNVNECASNSYVSPSGLYTWTTDGTYNDTLITDLGCDSIITVNLTFNNLQQSVVYNPASVNFCETGSAQFEVASSQTDVVYELINMKDSSSISVLNGGGALIYNTGIISETSTYGLRVSKNGCDLILSDYFVATVSEYPNNNVIIDRTTLASYEIDGQYKWLDCNNANAAIAGETSLEFIPATAGNYALEVTNAAGCVDTSNCINFTPPVPASALNFDGSNDNITIEGVDISNQSFTIESWVKNERPNTDNIICGQGPAGGSTGLHIGFRSNNVFTMDFYANGLNTPDTYTDADWHHWACVYDAKATGTNRFIYRDGILVASDVANSDFLGNGTFYIGQHSWGANFKGSLDEFHVWKRALTQEQIMNRLYCSTSDDLTALILNYNFNQGDSAGVNTFESTLLNSASSSMHGTLNNFALNGATSNWVAPGAISNNASCSNCVTQQVTINASSCGEAYVSPSGNYTWTTSGTYTDTVFTAYSCDSIITINFTNNSIDTAITRNGNMILSSQPNAAYTWLDCANAYAVIGGESAQSYSPAAAGSYAVAITRGTCVDTSNCFAYTPLPAFVEQFCIPTLGNNDMYRTIISNDYNGDGFVDMMARDDWGITRYFTNDGTGNFTGPVDLFPSNTAYVLYNHDLDSDGDVDVIGVNGTTQGHIYINDGAGNFTELSGVDLMNGTGIITAMDFGDVNGDGMIDIVTGNNNFSLSTDMNEVWLNTGSVGSPNFAYYSGVQNVNGGRNSVDLGDIDGDGDLDMATGSVSWRGYIYLNDGSGNFTQHVEYSEYSGAARFADWDNDGDLDRVNYDVYNNYGLRVSFNDGLGNMSYPPTHIMSMSTANNCVLSDFNSDGLLDLVFDHWGGNADVYLNTGCGFVKETSAPMSNASHGVHVNDFNNDGRPDVLCAGREISSCFQMNNMPTATAVPMSTIASVETDSSCGSSALVLAASATNGGGVNWYDASTGGNYLGNGNNYITPTLGNTATYYVEAVNAVGCKSARVPVVASVYNNPTVTISGAPVSIVCPGESVTLAASGADTYVWNPSTVSDNIPFTVYETDSYQVTGTDMHGCSNTASVTVNVASTSSNNVMATICEGQTFAVGADNYDTEGVYNITLVNASGCDSLVILNLSVNSINNVSVTAAICQGDDYTVGTSTYNSTGMHITTLTNMYGCDSTVTLDLTVNDLPIVSFAFATDTVCKDGGIIVLSGTPALGTFSGTSVTGTDFDPSTFGASTLVTVTYSHTDGNGCAASASDDIFVDICSGIAKMKSVAVSIRPNPTVGVVEINSTLPGEQPIKVLNGLGQTIFVSKMTTIKQIDFSNLSNGVYTVKVGDGSNAEYIKVVKE